MACLRVFLLTFALARARQIFRLLVCLGAVSYLFFGSVWGAGGSGREQALVMLLLWVLLGVREVNTLAPEASLSARRRHDGKTPGDPSSRRTLPRPTDLRPHDPPSASRDSATPP